MNFKEHFKFSDGNQIWRLLISDRDKLVIETRDTDKKEVFFNCVSLRDAKEVFSKFQFEEKYWIGIEKIHDNIIFFHRFAKPDLPGHREIIAFDIDTQKILWQTMEFTFLFIYNNKLYASKELFEGNKFFILDYKSGEVISELETDSNEITRLKNIAEEETDYGNYIFTENFDSEKSFVDENIKSIIKSNLGNAEYSGNIEFAVVKDLLLFNYHEKTNDDTLTNKFFAVDLDTGEEKFSDILNTNTNAYAPDSFFCYKDYVIILKEKKEVMVFKID